MTHVPPLQLPSFVGGVLRSPVRNELTLGRASFVPARTKLIGNRLATSSLTDNGRIIYSQVGEAVSGSGRAGRGVLLISEVITAIVGLIIGLITGFFFERRATSSARSQNEELRRALMRLSAMVRSLGGDPDREVITERVDDLPGKVRARALATQNASGKVRRQELITHFIARGVRASDIEAAIAELCRDGVVREDGRWLRIQ